MLSSEVIVNQPKADYDAWAGTETPHAPEAEFIEKLKAIEGVSDVETQTFTFELWHAFTLKRIAALHEEFSASFGNASAAKVYRVSCRDHSAVIWLHSSQSASNIVADRRLQPLLLRQPLQPVSHLQQLLQLRGDEDGRHAGNRRLQLDAQPRPAADL